mgnify:CR=1 FL=1
MNIGQLRRLLRTLPTTMTVLLSDSQGAFSARQDDFVRVEMTGQWGPVALVISPFEPPFRRHRRFMPREAMRPIERVRAHRRWVQAQRRREAWAFNRGAA